ncbi:hypothetical protein CDAR_187901 [Caerostris darwini]|uniref:Uncharacterized protein n=1 Tax=Caerostris darwini TaxID=1538125 RepID=A0AAV4R7H2_9ARAC|nr:hypothetical protein CDAR_187901 [Caerostris darwini]
MVRWVTPEMNPQEMDPAAQNEALRRSLYINSFTTVVKMVRWVTPEMNPQEMDPAAQNEGNESDGRYFEMEISETD